MVRLFRTDSTDVAFNELVRHLDAELAERDGKEHSFYSQYNKIDAIRHAIVGYENGIPVGCGAIKEFNSTTTEVKRMYVMPAHRGKGVASGILNALEAYARELGYNRCVLETGKRQPEAIALYTKCGYTIIPNYGQYVGIENSVCFEKQLLSV